jgi:YegS/Rv2252/BmrU family lipid kinase
LANKTMVIVNPASSNGKTNIIWPDIKNRLEKENLEFDFSATSCQSEATHFAREALHKGYETIISVGGDGTLNEVVNGFFENGQLINSSAKLGLIAAGTGGDFIRTLEYPRDYAQACRLIARGHTRQIDIGKSEYYDHKEQLRERYFINVAGFGMDGAVVDRVNRTSKFFGGFISFLYGTLAALTQFKSLSVSLQIDDELVWEGPITAVAVANGQYFGGSMQIAPEAVIDDGIFEIILVKGMPKTKLLQSLPTIYSGAHVHDPNVSCFKGTKVKAVSTERVLLEVDGEQPGVLNAEFSIMPKILNIIC